MYKKIRYTIGMIYKINNLKKRMKQKPLKIVVGAGRFTQDGWIETNIDMLNLLKSYDWKRFFKKNSIDAILAEHVWEHLTLKEGISAARTCFQYLKYNGYLRAAVPDGLHPDPKYIEWVKPGGIGLGAEDHRVMYTYKSFKEIFELAGFKVDFLEYFDEKGQFHYKEWDSKDGMIRRSKRFDKRNKDEKLNYTSIIMDVRKVS